MTQPARGVVAAGHAGTAGAAREILAEGGNAFDAAVAAGFAACVAEPLLASLGGGGFLLSRTADGRVSVFDFFGQTPIHARHEHADFYPIEGDFGHATQIFHIGLGSVATPGVVKGMFRVRDELGTLPMTRLVEPAMALARDGVIIDEVRAYVQQVLRPIVLATPEVEAVFGGGDIQIGSRWSCPAMAETLAALAAEGEELFYRGELARRLTVMCAEGGHLTADDLERYQVIRRDALRWSYRGNELSSNPEPSTGGLLIAFALKLIEESAPPTRFGSLEHTALLLRTMELTNRARVDAMSDNRGAESMLRTPFLTPYHRALREHRSASRGTTHVSVADGQGNLASLSLSNGEGCGHILPGTGIMLNNMLGEDDLHPEGLSRWPKNVRMASMMAPTLLDRADGSMVVLGSGGSNRLRTAILQVLINLVDLGLPLEEAVGKPRMHFEGDRLDIEPGFPDATVEALAKATRQHRVWDRRTLFFGGVHAVEVDGSRGVLSGAGDPRRGGVSLTL